MASGLRVKVGVTRLGTFAIDLFASTPIGDSPSCSFKGTRTTHTTRSLESKIPLRAEANSVADADTKSRLMSKNSAVGQCWRYLLSKFTSVLPYYHWPLKFFPRYPRFRNNSPHSRHGDNLSDHWQSTVNRDGSYDHPIPSQQFHCRK